MGESSAAKRLLRRSRDSERHLGKWLLENDGPDPEFMPGNGIVTNTGRVGHVGALQYDAHSRSYAAENKNYRLTTQWIKWWLQIVSRSIARNKEALLVLDPSNKPNTFVLDGARYRIPRMHIITEERHGHLLRAERELIALKEALEESGVVEQTQPLTR